MIPVSVAHEKIEAWGTRALESGIDLHRIAPGIDHAKYTGEKRARVIAPHQSSNGAFDSRMGPPLFVVFAKSVMYFLRTIEADRDADFELDQDVDDFVRKQQNHCLEMDTAGGW